MTIKTETKRWWASTGVWGSLTTLVAGVAVATGVLVPDDATALQQSASEVVAQTVGVVGALVALWGRIRATAAIRF